MSQFFQLSFWFDIFPLPFTPATFWTVLGLFLAGLALGVVTLFFQKKFSANKLVKRIWVKLTGFGLSFGLAGLFLTFLKQQRISYLGMRIWLGLWLLVCLVWLGFILKYIVLDMPKLKGEKKKKEELEKYLP